MQERRNMVRQKIEWAHSIGLMSVVDVVWNHTSCDTPWLKEHPEAAYNLENSPHLKPAYDLDDVILAFSAEKQRNIENENDLEKVLEEFKTMALVKAALWEYFVVDVETAMNEFEKALDGVAFKGGLRSQSLNSQVADFVINDGSYSRHSLRIKDYGRLIWSLYGHELEQKQEEDMKKYLCDRFKADLDAFNLPLYQSYDHRVQTILTNLQSRIGYERLDEHGPHLGPVNSKNPLVSPYFTRIGNHAFVNNGWIWGADPLINFADASSESYLLREVVIWGDCVKLRYGEGPFDSPWLWQHMTEYTELMASMFDGFRIDNCHSTPLHVAKYLLDKARSVKPELYICAELFTSSTERDYLYVKTLGLHSLIREAMSAGNVDHLAHMVRECGGDQLGAVIPRSEYLLSETNSVKGPLVTSRLHALFADCTHDNEMPAQKRSILDTLPNAAIVAFACSAIGTVQGYDDLLMRNPNIVSEDKLYSIEKALLAPARKVLNQLHSQMARSFTQIEVNTHADLVVIVRADPVSGETITMITRTTYSSDVDELSVDCSICDSLQYPDIQLHDNAHLEFLATVCPDPSAKIDSSDKVIGGVSGYKLSMSDDPLVFGLTRTKQKLSIDPSKFRPAGVAVFKSNPTIQASPLDIPPIITSLELSELNILLYRCEAEESDSTPINGTYDLPNYGKLTYAGIAGFHHLIEEIYRKANNNHPLVKHLIDGSWAMYYCSNRIKARGSDPLESLSKWMESRWLIIESFPVWHRPRMFFDVINALYEQVLYHIFTNVFGNDLSSSSFFIKQLALGAVQLLGRVHSTGLSPNTGSIVSLAAGLPHFSTHHMRCWGRDTFIAFRGLFLRTGLWQEARNHLIAFASCCFNGLIPNLLDAQRFPRFNARDATWWWAKAIQDYWLMAPDGKDVFDFKVERRFPVKYSKQGIPNFTYCHFTDPLAYSETTDIRQILQDVLQCHADGISFTEPNAGPSLDPVMQSPGFQIDVSVDWNTGFIHGGNKYNAGTWMDKMGESKRSGNFGLPTTPRDGAPIEITALLASTLHWLSQVDPSSFVLVNDKKIQLSHWSHLIHSSFDSHYFIPTDPKEDAAYHLNPFVLVHRGYFKDLVGGHCQRAPYQLRPNYLIAMAEHPLLFTQTPQSLQHAVRALDMAEEYLSAPLGMRTLSMDDPQYRPDYFVSSDSDDPLTAHGANYHQGPEWLWLLGAHLRSLYFIRQRDSLDVKEAILARLSPHNHLISTSPWRGLPELTNGQGAYCPDSCPTQAWTMATLLDLLLLIDEK